MNIKVTKNSVWIIFVC